MLLLLLLWSLLVFLLPRVVFVFSSHFRCFRRRRRCRSRSRRGRAEERRVVRLLHVHLQQIGRKQLRAAGGAAAERRIGGEERRRGRRRGFGVPAAAAAPLAPLSLAAIVRAARLFRAPLPLAVSEPEERVSEPAPADLRTRVSGAGTGGRGRRQRWRRRHWRVFTVELHAGFLYLVRAAAESASAEASAFRALTDASLASLGEGEVDEGEPAAAAAAAAARLAARTAAASSSPSAASVAASSALSASARRSWAAAAAAAVAAAFSSVDGKERASATSALATRKACFCFSGREGKVEGGLERSKRRTERTESLFSSLSLSSRCESISLPRQSWSGCPGPCEERERKLCGRERARRGD